VTVYSLNFHADYRCRHSGACCTAGWPIPVEPRLLPLLGVELLVPDAAGVCTHFDRQSHLCKVQRDHGEDMLPASCHQFPRRALIDERGTFITLSNFCPTAAALLYDYEQPAAIVSAPPAFPERRGYEGLDARGQWPPLVRPGVLFDLASYSRWEAFIVSTLARDTAVDEALCRIATAAERLRAWTPESGSFEAWTTNTLETPVADSQALEIYSRYRRPETYDTLRGFVLEGLSAPQPPSASPQQAVSESSLEARAVRRYLAAKAFASWSAYEGHGLRTLVAELAVSEVVLRTEHRRQQRSASVSGRTRAIEAIRQADLLLIHLLDRPRLIEWLGQVENAHHQGHNGLW